MLSDSQAIIERSIYHAIRRKCIAEGYTPDVSLFDLANEAGQQQYRLALKAIQETKGFAIEVFGASNSQQKGIKQVPRISITPGTFLPGEVGYGPTTIYSPNGDNTFTGTKVPIEASDYHVDIHLVSNDIQQNRVLNSILASCLYRKGYIPVYPHTELQLSKNLFYLNTVNVDSDKPSEGLIEKVHNYIFHDVHNIPEEHTGTVAALQEIVIDLALDDIITEEEYVHITIPDYDPPPPEPPSCGPIPNMPWDVIEGCLTPAQIQEAIGSICPVVTPPDPSPINGDKGLIGSLPSEKALLLEVINTEQGIVPYTASLDNTPDPSILKLIIGLWKLSIIDQWGNAIKSVTLVPYQSDPIVVELPLCGDPVFEGTGAGLGDINTLWYDTGSLSNGFPVYTNEAGWTISYFNGAWLVYDPLGVGRYYINEGAENPWEGEWIAFEPSINPPPNFSLYIPPGAHLRIGDGLNGYAEWEDLPSGEVTTIPVVDEEDNPVQVTRVGNKLQVPTPEPPEPEPPYPSIRFSTKPDNLYDPESYTDFAVGGNGFFRTDADHYYGHNYRFCSKLGYTDGTDYFLHGGTPSDKATVFADGYVLDMLTWQKETQRALAVKLTLEGSATGGSHRSQAESHVYAGIGPGRWFMWNAQVYFNLSQDKRGSTDHLNYPPFDFSPAVNQFLILNNADGITTLHYLRVYTLDNNITNGGNSSAHQTFYCCWFDLEND